MTSPRLAGSLVSRLGHGLARAVVGDSERSRRLARRWRPWLLTGAAIAIVPASITAALALSARGESDPGDYRVLARQEVRVPSLDLYRDVPTASNAPLQRSLRVAEHETLGSLFARLGLRDPEAQSYAAGADGAHELVAPQAGGYVIASVEPDRRLRALSLYLDDNGLSRARVLRLERDDQDRLTLSLEPYEFDLQTSLAGGLISGTPDASLAAAGVPPEIVRQMHGVFDADRDQVADLRPGDSWRMVYEIKYTQGNFVRYGRLLALSLTHEGQTSELFWFDDGSQDGHYYNERGEISRRVFMRVPLDMKRVSSEFAALRRHPITGVLRPHQGTDFNAPWGAVVRAAADGEVEFAGVGTGYGKYVRIRHGHDYQTIYAHLSSIARSIQPGVTVRYGQEIGRVGQTGLATGPHLHYELKLDGIQVNPMTSHLPDQSNLSPYQLTQLEARVAPLKEKLAQIERIQAAGGPNSDLQDLLRRVAP